MPERKSFLDTMSETNKPESFKQEKFVAVKDNKKKIKIIIAAAVAVVLIVGGYLVYTAMDSVKIPTLVGMTLTDATDWASKNKITLSVQNTYDFNTVEGTILTQEIASGTTVRKNSTITIGVSEGADPSEAITFPDISSMTSTEIETWISDNKLTGVKIATAYSDVVAVNKVISYTMTDDTEANFKRKSRVTVNVSLGPETATTTVVVSDFSAMKAGEVIQWGSDNGVTVTLKEAYDNYIESGYVISQSVAATTEILKTAPITVTISIGKPITVLDFSSMTQDEATAWAKTNNVTLTILTKYTNSNNMGKVLAQSITAGTSMKAGDELRLTYSLGRVDVANYIGKTKLDIASWQNTANTKGANVQIKYVTDYGVKGSAGTIIAQSIKNDFVDPGTTITVTVSKGMKVLTPDFSGMTQSECTTLAQSSNVSILFNFQASSTVGNGLVISQSPDVNTVIADSDNIIITISSSGATGDTVIVPDFSTMKASAVQQWGTDEGVTVVLTQVYSTYFSSGSIVSQSVTKNTVTSKSTIIYVNVSKGPAPSQVTVPDFTAMSKDEADLWAKVNNVTLFYKYMYSDSLTTGYLYNQNAASGTSVDAGSVITITSSLGMVELDNFVGSTQLDAQKWATDANAEGANVTVDFLTNYDSTQPKGKIYQQSLSSGYIALGSTVYFYVSIGPAAATATPTPTPIPS
jgi:beta-lactam-binding protein with PASTA domain